jgi:hypothetical protein
MTDAETLETLALLAQRILDDGCTLTLNRGLHVPGQTTVCAMLSKAGVILAVTDAPDLTNAIRFALEAAKAGASR